MELDEIIKKLEEIVNENEHVSTENEVDRQEQPSTVASIKEIILLIFSFVISVLKAPYRAIARYLKNEIVSTIKKDVSLYGLIAAMTGILVLLLTVLWLYITMAVTAYFYDQGEPLFNSLIYSLGFQVVTIIIIAIIAFIASRNIKSIKLIKSLSKN